MTLASIILGAIAIIGFVFLIFWAAFGVIVFIVLPLAIAGIALGIAAAIVIYGSLFYIIIIIGAGIAMAILAFVAFMICWTCVALGIGVVLVLFTLICALLCCCLILGGSLLGCSLTCGGLIAISIAGLIITGLCCPPVTIFMICFIILTVCFWIALSIIYFITLTICYSIVVSTNICCELLLAYIIWQIVTILSLISCCLTNMGGNCLVIGCSLSYVLVCLSLTIILACIIILPILWTLCCLPSFIFSSCLVILFICYIFLYSMIYFPIDPLRILQIIRIHQLFSDRISFISNAIEEIIPMNKKPIDIIKNITATL